LSAKQLHFWRETLPLLNQGAVSVIMPAEPLALLLNSSGPLDANRAALMASALGQALTKVLREDSQMEKLTFMTGDYLRPVEVLRNGQAFEAHTDFDIRIEGLRDQIGFFPESPRAPIEDLQGYPNPQFAVAISGRKWVLIRVPVISRGYYLGDLTAEYSIK